MVCRPIQEEADVFMLDEPLLAELYSASITGRVATGPRADKRIVRVGEDPNCLGAITNNRIDTFQLSGE